MTFNPIQIVTFLCILFLVKKKGLHSGSSDSEIGWNKFSGNCYTVVRKRVNWDTAKSSCWGRGGQLTSIGSKEENDFIRSLTSGTDSWGAWLGGTDSALEGRFSWIDGSDWKYHNWHPNEPNNGGHGEDCIVLVSIEDENWNDMPCTESHRVSAYVCKKLLI